MGTSEVEHVLATQTLLQYKAKTFEVRVDQLQVDVQNRLLACFGMDDVTVPNLLEHRAAWRVISHGSRTCLPKKRENGVSECQLPVLPTGKRLPVFTEYNV